MLALRECGAFRTEVMVKVLSRNVTFVPVDNSASASSGFAGCPIFA